MSASSESNKRERDVNDQEDDQDSKKISTNEEKEITFWNYRWLIIFFITHQEYTETLPLWVYNDIQAKFFERLLFIRVFFKDFEYFSNFLTIIFDILSTFKDYGEGWTYLKKLMDKEDDIDLNLKSVLNFVNGKDNLINQILDNPDNLIHPIEFQSFNKDHLKRQKEPDEKTFYRTEYYVLEMFD